MAATAQAIIAANSKKPDPISTDAASEEFERLFGNKNTKKAEYVGDRPLRIVESGEWPESLLGGQFRVLNELYDNFLNAQNSLVRLCFKKLGIYSFGGFGASADTEGNAAFFNDDGGDSTFDSLSKIRGDELQTYLVIPINPEEISVNYQINTTSHQTIFFSELATLSGLKLRRFKIESFFPYRIGEECKYGTEPIYRPQDYIRWITDCMNNKIILAFKAFGQVAEPLPYMKCFIEDFTTTLRPNGEVAYSLSICEYIDYRKEMDTRMFVMDGETLIVSKKEQSRGDGKIGLGDLVRVVNGSIYSDRLKHNTFSVGNITNSFFRFSPSIWETRLVTSKNALINSVIYNIANTETIDFIVGMIKAKVNVDETEIWMVVGGDYFSKYRPRDINWLNVYQIKKFVEEASPQSLTHSIKIRSMKDNRIGWVNLKQLEKVYIEITR